MGRDFERELQAVADEIEDWKDYISFWEALGRADVVADYKSKLKRARRRRVAIRKQQAEGQP